MMFQERWNKMNNREQKIVAWGGIGTILIMLYAFVWDPWQLALTQLQQQLPAKRTDAAWIESLARLAQQIDRSGGRRPAASGPILTVVENSAKAAGIRDQINQMSPGETSGQVRIWLDSTSFDQWLKWIDELYVKDGVQVVEAAVQRGRENKVDIRATLSK